PDKLREAVAITQEVIGGARRSINDTTAPQSPELKILRAARHLADNDTAETMAWLRQTELPEPALLELEAELCAAEPDGKARAIQVLQDLTAREPSRRILRRFAELVAGSNARTDLFKVLQRADPGSGTFSIEERWLLSSWGGQRLELGRDDMLSLSEKNLALAIALGPTELPAPNVANASDTALLVQLGAGLLRLRKPETGTPLSESALLALEELKRRGSSPYLTSSVDLILAKTAE